MELTRRPILSLLFALVLTGALALIGTPVNAAQPAPVVYDALGDSYASGYGVPPYTGGNCARSASAPAELVDGRKHIALDDFVACAGAKTSDMASQLTALDANTGLVTVSIGGNDIGWSQAVQACIAYPQAVCAQAIGQSVGAATGLLPSRLDAVFAGIRSGAPHAHVVVTGYPELFSPAYGDWQTPFGTVTVAEQGLLNAGADTLNGVISAAAARAGFEFVDVTKRFDGHGVNAPDAWIGGLTSPGPFHPTLAGYEEYAAAITAAVNPNEIR